MTQLQPSPRALMLAVALATLCPSTHAEIYELKDFPVPGKYTLNVHRVIYAYGGPETAELTAKVEGNGTKVEFRDVRVISPKAGAKAATQVGLVPYDRLYDFLDMSGNFCVQGGLALQSVKTRNGAQPIVSSFIEGVGKELSQGLPATGMYALIISNCGGEEGGSLEGSIAIKSPWGYLPATHYYKESFYGALAVGNSFVAVAWLVFSLRWWRQLLPFQKGMAVVALVCVLEATLWWLFYVTWNSSGTVNKALFWVAQMASEGKVLAAMISVLTLQLVSEEQMMTDSCYEQADAVMPVRQHFLMAVFLVFEFNRAVNTHFRYQLAFTMNFVLLNAAPAIIVGIALWVCVHQQLNEVLSELKLRTDSKATLMKRVQLLMLLALIMVLATVAVQFYDPTMSKDDTTLWKYHFVVSDGLAQGSFLSLLIAAMAFSFPSEALQGASYAPQQMDENVIGAPAVIWDDEDDLGEPPQKSKAHLDVEGGAGTFGGAE